MSEKNNGKFTQVLLGIVSAICLWAIGLLLSGHFVLGEDVLFHHFGFLSFAFPALAFFAFTLFAKLSVKNNKKTFCKTALICSFLPLVLYAVLLLVTLCFDDMPANILMLPLALIISPAASVFSGMLEAVDKTGISEVAENVFVLVTLLVPMFAGIIASIVIYKKGSKPAAEQGENSAYKILQ